MPESVVSASLPRPRVLRPTAAVTWHRDGYFALEVKLGDGANRTKLGRAWRAVQKVLDELEAGSVDEHRAPAWSIGAHFDKKPGGPGSAVNRSIYGVDLVAGQPLAVVQVRHWLKSRYQVKHGYHGRTLHAWFMEGRNEGTKLPFAHPINPRSIVRELNGRTAPERPVTLARAWVFGVDVAALPEIIRQGDVALVPVPRLPGGRRERVEGSPAGVQVLDRHVLQSPEVWRYGAALYARDPFVQHLGQQHADVFGRGWFRVQVGLRSTPRPFARPIGD